MAAKKKASDEPQESELETVELETELTDRVLENTPPRVLKFILGARRYPHIFNKLRARGYSNAVARKPWMWLDALGGFEPNDPGASSQEATEDEKKVAKAISDIDGWDEPNFRLINSALRRAFPEQHKFVFAGELAAQRGSVAVIGVRKMMKRLAALESSSERKDTRKEDHAALARLAERGIDAAERKKVEGWLAIVGKLDDEEDGSAEQAEAVASHEKKRKQTLILLREWFEEWADVARVAIKSKRDLMHLGLAQQSRGGGGGGTGNGGEGEGGGGPVD